MITSLWRSFVWRFFGGKLAEKHFQCLSESILDNRRLISELKAAVSGLQLRVWELEGHTPEESQEMEFRLIKYWSSAQPVVDDV